MSLAFGIKASFFSPRHAAISLATAAIMAVVGGCGKIKELTGGDPPQAPASSGTPSPRKWTTIPVTMKLAADLGEVQQNAILSAVKTWEWATGLSLINYGGTTTAHNGTADGLKSLMADNINGAYVVADWSDTATNVDILAVTEYTVTGADQNIMVGADIFFNNRDYAWIDTLALLDGVVVADTETVALHELGHFLGLQHVPVAVDPFSIMNPTIATGIGAAHRRLDRADILNMQAVYGCLGEACNVDTLIANETSQLPASAAADPNIPGGAATPAPSPSSSPTPAPSSISTQSPQSPAVGTSTGSATGDGNTVNPINTNGAAPIAAPINSITPSLLR